MKNIQSSETIISRSGLIALVGIVGIVALMIFAAFRYNTFRQNVVIEQQTAEVETLKSEHNEDFVRLFTQSFDACNMQFITEKAPVDASKKTVSIICQNARQTLSEMNVYTLTNSSAMVYARFSGSKVEIIDASGNYYPPEEVMSAMNYRFSSRYETTKIDLIDHITEQKPILLWQDFIGYLPGKEVLIEITDDGKTIGYIFKSVIER